MVQFSMYDFDGDLAPVVSLMFEDERVRCLSP